MQSAGSGSRSQDFTSTSTSTSSVLFCSDAHPTSERCHAKGEVRELLFCTSWRGVEPDIPTFTLNAIFPRQQLCPRSDQKTPSPTLYQLKFVSAKFTQQKISLQPGVICTITCICAISQFMTRVLHLYDSLTTCIAVPLRSTLVCSESASVWC